VTVEQCKSIGVAELLGRGRPAGSLRWSRGGRLDYRAIPDRGMVVLVYNDGPGAADEVQGVRLATTSPHFGGRRWWFLCPRCAARVAVLYRRPRQAGFACRACHDLTYESAQLRGTWLGQALKQFGVLARR
jgi:hypothetical protein